MSEQGPYRTKKSYAFDSSADYVQTETRCNVTAVTGQLEACVQNRGSRAAFEGPNRFFAEKVSEGMILRGFRLG